MQNANLDSFTVVNSSRNKPNTAILCLLIIILGNLVGAALVGVQLEKSNNTGVLLAGNTQDGCHENQNYAMIVEDLLIIYEKSGCNIPVNLIDWSDLNQKQLLVDVRKSCNGQRKCLLNGSILTAYCDEQPVKPERFNVTYSCYPTSMLFEESKMFYDCR
ncbi:uncharacterized protein LOC131942183 [Physella acuta]|uniref:uncharacterized protein LOC131942183 n=1 Tax=Physella acuta TaxID=109671 RepID=UPI0027DB2060|nr:uncharacterized protein LOC131942183 [Physella acuta]